MNFEEKGSWGHFTSPILSHLLQTFIFAPANLTNTPFQTLGGFLNYDVNLRISHTLTQFLRQFMKFFLNFQIF